MVRHQSRATRAAPRRRRHGTHCAPRAGAPAPPLGRPCCAAERARARARAGAAGRATPAAAARRRRARARPPPLLLLARSPRAALEPPARGCSGRRRRASAGAVSRFSRVAAQCPARRCSERSSTPLLLLAWRHGGGARAAQLPRKCLPFASNCVAARARSCCCSCSRTLTLCSTACALAV